MDISIILNGEVLIPAAVLNSVGIVLVLSLFFMICSRAVKKADPSLPSKGLVFFLELIVTNVEAICKAMINDQKGRFGPFIGMLIIYLVVANLMGLLGLTTPTSNYNVTLSLAIFALGYLNFSGIRIKGLGTHLKDMFLGDFPVLVLLNVIGEVSKILSLSFRLFGNILSGSVITFVVIHLTGWVAILLMPALNLYFDIFAGLLQTMIFCFLLMIWLGDATAIE